jgi:hypothetical protein
MKKLFVSLALASTALVAAAPANAQDYDRYDRDRYEDRYDRGRWDDRQDDRYQRDGWNRFGYRGEDLKPRLDRIGWQISRGLERGNITPNEARRLRAEIGNIYRLSQHFWRSHGYDPRERAELNRRINWLQQQVRFERRDDDRRWRY